MEKLIIFVVIIVSAKAQMHEDKVIKVNMDDPADCGKIQHLMIDQKLTLQSNGSSQSGQCKISVKSHGKSNCEISRELCMEVKKSNIVDCNAKVTFTETLVGGRVGERKELHCESVLTDKWCTISDLIEVELTEKGNMTRDYAFHVTVSSGCAQVYDHKQVNQVDADNYSRLLGIITGLACCSVFLVLFIISYCFFRSQGWGQQPPEQC